MKVAQILFSFLTYVMSKIKRQLPLLVFQLPVKYPPSVEGNCTLDKPHMDLKGKQGDIVCVDTKQGALNNEQTPAFRRKTFYQGSCNVMNTLSKILVGRGWG